MTETSFPKPSDALTIYLEEQVYELETWLKTYKAKTPKGSQYIVFSEDVYVMGHGVLNINPLRAVKLDLKGACALASHLDNHTPASGGGDFSVCVQKDAAEKALHTIKKVLAVLKCVEGNMI